MDSRQGFLLLALTDTADISTITEDHKLIIYASFKTFQASKWHPGVVQRSRACVCVCVCVGGGGRLYL